MPKMGGIQEDDGEFEEAEEGEWTK